ncbi:Acetyltransferase (GNAT) family protein [Flexibacter flexilis DSM 6793]|uniref:Acetyltransferase (GNAT) family protein n=1 Tax=Flexibacter flexilis DSM 6793 TaxID=927664 RepID=A0A1I1I3C6_9BACT|nr:GNAT family N-acetyltransferase [Flexibacter flexilis]SFC30591.1 Acetyltransferase (GNAT) family protein [Flexibacter flexilis DSM 6793]
MIIRQANIQDIPQIQVVRNAVRENTLSNPNLVTDADVVHFLTQRGKGWVCAIDHQIVGFSIADLQDHNIWALFVHPDFDRRGIGRQLHDVMLDWYFSQTQQTVWLGTSPNTRAEGFYKKAGWKVVGTHGSKEVKFEMTFSDWNRKYNSTMINTERLQLIAANTATLQLAIAGNQYLGHELKVQVLDDWSEFGVDALRYALDKLAENPEENGWWTYWAVHPHDQKLIGGGGYKGQPSPDGVVEIGYEIAPSYRNCGLATEMAKGLITNAFSHQNVTIILAHTLAQENPSTKVLRKCGFTMVAQLHDPNEGFIWQWQLNKDSK